MTHDCAKYYCTWGIHGPWVPQVLLFRLCWCPEIIGRVVPFCFPNHIKYWFCLQFLLCLAPDEREYQENILIISPQKHILQALIRSDSVRHFWWVLPQHFFFFFCGKLRKKIPTFLVEKKCLIWLYVLSSGTIQKLFPEISSYFLND